MVWIYRLTYSKSKAVGTCFRLCVQYLTHETHRKQALGKHHYDDSARYKANLTFSVIGRKGRNALALRAKEFLERDRFRHEVLYKGMTIHQLLSSVKSNRRQNDISEKLFDKFRVKYITETAPMPF